MDLIELGLSVGLSDLKGLFSVILVLAQSDAFCTYETVKTKEVSSERSVICSPKWLGNVLSYSMNMA